MDIRPFRRGHDLRTRRDRGAPNGSEAGDKFDVLDALVESYEARRLSSHDSFLDRIPVSGINHS